MDGATERAFWRSAFWAQVGVTMVVAVVALPTLLVTLGAPVGGLGPWLAILVYVGIPGWPISAALVQLILQGAIAWMATRVALDLRSGDPDPEVVRRGLLLAAVSLSYMAIVWWMFIRRLHVLEDDDRLHFLDRAMARRAGWMWAMVQGACVLAMGAATGLFVAAPPFAVFMLIVAAAVQYGGVALMRRHFGRIDLHKGLPRIAADPYATPSRP